MRALVYHGPGDKSWQEVPDPSITMPTDVIVRVDTTTICETDVRIVHGEVPTVEPGRILGHEAVGTIVETGTADGDLRVGDRVIVPAITSCGACSACKKSMPSHCQAVGGIGWALGHLIDGTQAEYVRVPYGQTSLYLAPQEMRDEELVFLADLFPTGYEMGVRHGEVALGDVVVVLGAGPVGLAATATAGFHGASRIIAVGQSRWHADQALGMGADLRICTDDPHWVDHILAESRDGTGPDVVIETVGDPAMLESAFQIVRPGGRVAHTGWHGSAVHLPSSALWLQSTRFTTGLVDTTSIPLLLDMMRAGKLDTSVVGTHEYALTDIFKAYECFESPSTTQCLRTVLRR